MCNKNNKNDDDKRKENDKEKDKHLKFFMGVGKKFSEDMKFNMGPIEKFTKHIESIMEPWQKSIKNFSENTGALTGIKEEIHSVNNFYSKVNNELKIIKDHIVQPIKKMNTLYYYNQYNNLDNTLLEIQRLNKFYFEQVHNIAGNFPYLNDDKPSITEVEKEELRVLASNIYKLEMESIEIKNMIKESKEDIIKKIDSKITLDSDTNKRLEKILLEIKESTLDDETIFEKIISETIDIAIKKGASVSFKFIFSIFKDVFC